MNIRAREVLAIPTGLDHAIVQIWNSIAPDLNDSDEVITNEEAIRLCLDADRLKYLANRKDLQEYVSSVFAEDKGEDLVLQLAETVHIA